MRTYLQQLTSERIRHPRESGGPFYGLKNMDYRLRGNDDRV